MSGVIDADTHISESEAMWNMIDKELYDRRPIMLKAPEDTFYGPRNAFWLIDGNIFPKPNGKGSFRLITPSASKLELSRGDIHLACREMTDIPGRLPVGKEIVIAGFKTLVIGVLKKEGKGGISDNGMDELTLVPLNFGKTFINMKNRFIDAQLMIKAKPGVAIQELSDETTMILRAARSLRPEELSNFSVNQASMLSQGLDSIFVAINIGGWIIGGFSILVGGFGIANIMFVSVRERTNIIGIQKALGAKKFFILQQFLVESMLLSIIGGLLGVFMIFLGTLVVNYLWDLNMYLTIGNTLLAVFISGIIGIVAGYAPANAAAKMNPVEAIGFSF